MSNLTDHTPPQAVGIEQIRQKHPAPIPKAALFGMFGLALTVLVLVSIARLTGFEPLNTPQLGEVAAARTVLLDTRADGGLDVIDPASGELVIAFPETEGGFMLGAHRAYMIARKRIGSGIDLAAPDEVVRWADGRMSLIDPETGGRAEIHNFGLTAQENFARVLAARG